MHAESSGSADVCSGEIGSFSSAILGRKAKDISSQNCQDELDVLHMQYQLCHLGEVDSVYSDFLESVRAAQPEQSVSSPSSEEASSEAAAEEDSLSNTVMLLFEALHASTPIFGDRISLRGLDEARGLSDVTKLAGVKKLVALFDEA